MAEIVEYVRLISVKYKGCIFTGIPEGYKYIAADEDGQVFVYKKLPKLYDQFSMYWDSEEPCPMDVGYVHDVDAETSLEEIE